MHVSPSGHADNVLREFAPRTADQAAAGAAEPRYTTTIHVPADHPAGTYWYHPHLHGATAEQIVGGMAGVIVVEGDVDEVGRSRQPPTSSSASTNSSSRTAGSPHSPRAAG